MIAKAATSERVGGETWSARRLCIIGMVMFLYRVILLVLVEKDDAIFTGLALGFGVLFCAVEAYIA